VRGVFLESVWPGDRVGAYSLSETASLHTRDVPGKSVKEKRKYLPNEKKMSGDPQGFELRRRGVSVGKIRCPESNKGG